MLLPLLGMSFLALSPAQEAQRPGFQVSLGLGLNHTFTAGQLGALRPSRVSSLPWSTASPCSPAADDCLTEATRRDPAPDPSMGPHTHLCRSLLPSICCNAWFTEGPFSNPSLCPCDHPQPQILLVSSVSPLKCLYLHMRLCPGFENPSRSSTGQKRINQSHMGPHLTVVLDPMGPISFTLSAWFPSMPAFLVSSPETSPFPGAP